MFELMQNSIKTSKLISLINNFFDRSSIFDFYPIKHRRCRGPVTFYLPYLALFSGILTYYSKLKKQKDFKHSLVLLGVTPLWHTALRVSGAPPHHTLPAFLNLNGRIKVNKLEVFIVPKSSSIILNPCQNFQGSLQ